MKHLKLTSLLAGGIVLLLCNLSQAQYTVTGTTPQGGNIVIGVGATTTALGPGSPLSSVGFDQVTLEPNFSLSGVSVGVSFQTSNDTVLNLGVIHASSEGINFDNSTTNNNIGDTVTNRGSISVTNGYAVIYESSGNTTGSPVNNWGSMSAPDGYAVLYDASGNVTSSPVNNWGSLSAPGGYAVLYDTGGNITGSPVNNWGSISAPGAYAILYYATGNIAGNPVNNWGSISAPDGYGVLYDTSSSNLGNAVNNWGTIATGSGGYPVYFISGSNNAGNAVNNWGSIISGNGGIAVYFQATGTNINNTVANWGVISGPGGGTAILINKSYGNVVNLNGHSAVYGSISITEAVANSSKVNLNFTGLTPSNLSALKSQLLGEGVGVNSGKDVTGPVTFTLRGVTYNIDPAVVNFNMSSYQLQAATPNEAAIGVVLDGLAYNPAPGTSLFALLNAIDQSGNVPGALEALSPQGFEIYGDLAIANSSFLVNSIDARLNNLRDGSESIDTSGIGGDTVAGLTKDDGKESKEIQTAAPAPNRWGFFATGDGLFFRGGNIGQSGKADTAGTLAGVDGKVGDHGVIGALFAYNNSAVTLGGASGQATIQSFTQGIYGSWKDDGFYTNGLAVFTRNDYKSSRNIAIPGFPATATADANSNQYTANADGGYDFNINSRLTLGPTLGLQYVHMDQFGFNESGAGAADLAVSGEDMNSLQTRLGFHADYHLLTGKFSSGALDFHAAWQHEYLNDSRPIGAAFEGTGLAPFSVQTASPLRDAAVVGTGLNFTFHNRLTLFTEYELEYWRSNTFEQTISGGARISF